MALVFAFIWESFLFCMSPIFKKPSVFHGFSHWKHLSYIEDHEQSIKHRRSSLTYLSQQKSPIQRQLRVQIDEEKRYWHEVLRRVVSVVKFLATRGLAFKGDNEIIGSQKQWQLFGCHGIVG
eukprot:Pompholyxophrys_punicea_v1_NODE_897_length_1163_cov_2.349278.p1 type:complete len:122 gc:universal NODE_897_length_1163_cov_2.349278:1016-651(-)